MPDAAPVLLPVEQARRCNCGESNATGMCCYAPGTCPCEQTRDSGLYGHAVGCRCFSCIHKDHKAAAEIRELDVVKLIGTVVLLHRGIATVELADSEGRTLTLVDLRISDLERMRDV